MRNILPGASDLIGRRYRNSFLTLSTWILGGVVFGLWKIVVAIELVACLMAGVRELGSR